MHERNLKDIKLEYDGDPFVYRPINSSNFNGPFLIQRSSSRNYPVFTKSGHWNEKQKIKYLIFLQAHHEKLNNKQTRRSWKIFKGMSDFIKTRNPNQCRSHHQKMEKHFDSAYDIYYNLIQKYQNFANRYQNYREQLAKIELTCMKGTECQIGEQEDKEYSQNGPVEERQKSGNEISIQQQLPPHEDNFKKQDLRPTDTDYNNEQKMPPSSISRQFMEKMLNLGVQKPVEIMPSFQSIRMSNPYLQQQKSYHHENPYIRKMHENFIQPSPISDFKFEGHNNMHEMDPWMECHYYYMKWITKLDSLVNQPNRQYPKSTGFL